MYKKHGVLALFLLLIVILVLKPRVIFNLYNNILGRLFLIGVIVFFTTCNVVLGLLVGLCLIIVSNLFFTEGMDNLNTDSKPIIQSGLTIGDDNAVSSTDAKVVVTTKAEENGVTVDGSKISDLQAKAQAQGVDRQTVQESIEAKSSKTIPVDKSNFKSTEVSPNESDSSVTEGFVEKYASF
jgi:hypothetical protein